MSSKPRPARASADGSERLAEAVAVLFELAGDAGPVERLWLAWGVHPDGGAATHARWFAWEPRAGLLEQHAERRADDIETPGTLADALRRERRRAPGATGDAHAFAPDVLDDAWQTLWRQGGVGRAPAPAGRTPWERNEELTLLAVRGTGRLEGVLVLGGNVPGERADLLHHWVVASAVVHARAALARAQLRHRSALTGFALGASTPGNLAEALHGLLRATRDAVNASGAALWRVDGAAPPRLELSSGPAGVRDAFANGLESVVLEVLASGGVRHAGDDGRGAGPAAAVAAELPAWVVAPIVAFGRPLGALAAWCGIESQTHERFVSSDVECVQALARQAALLLEVARQQEASADRDGERHATHERLRRLEAAEGLRELATRVASEARNPLASIGAFARRAQKAMSADDPERDSLAIVIHEAERLEAMLREQHHYSVLEPAPLRMESLNDSMQQSLQGVGEALVRRRLRLTKRLAPDLPRLLLDAPRIRRVFENVLAYALDAAPVGGRLRVETRRSGAFAMVEISHDGPRQAGDLMEQLFVPFGGATAPGAAVGLAVAHQIVREHGGEVRVRSEGEWSVVFSCTLPIAENADRRGRRERRGSANDRRRRGPDDAEGLSLG